MAQHRSWNQSDHDGDFTPVEEQPMEVEAPRRGASAQFIVDSTPGAEASLRDAMDPANRSLADALRLSYRLLQVVILGLIVVFLFSGFRTVQEGETGVRTFFGEIRGEDGQQQLAPGPQLYWPYPVGEIVVFPLHRTIELRKTFWPRLREGQNTEQATATADTGTALGPGVNDHGDGYLLTVDGDMVHIQIVAEYEIADAVDFLSTVNVEQTDLLVKRAIQRGAVQMATQYTMMQILELRDEPADAIRESAQQMLRETRTGIVLTSVSLPPASAPLAIRKKIQDVQGAREDAQAMVQNAKGEATKLLTDIAGPDSAELIKLIDSYEIAVDRGAGADADEKLASINTMLESDRIVGAAATIINHAKASESSIERTLGRDAQLLQGMLSSYHENPRLFVGRLWMEALRDALSSPTIEVVAVSDEAGQINLAIESSRELMQLRRKHKLKGDAERARMMLPDSGPYHTQSIDTIKIGGSANSKDATAKQMLKDKQER